MLSDIMVKYNNDNYFVFISKPEELYYDIKCIVKLN